MKPLDSAVLPAPERSLRPPKQKQESAEPQAVLYADSRALSPTESRRDEQNAGPGELITAGSLRELDGISASEPAVDDDVEESDSVRTENTMPNYLAQKEVSAMIRKLRQGASLWKRIQSVRVDEQRLEQVRDQMMSNQQLIR
ncbi:hypothetical protein [Crystallibacter degradans]|uniref:hypothetical protein n=1 Tax=Crystallibacter degradans TaxID=2726743 RepID=UPI0014740AFA|nr:hypothetical protein [Arthrobacter sp. SF27]NMR28814.1 hypothetical protein [Arthrobacter sp. SF27]